MKILVVDDELVSRSKLQTLFSSYGECHAAEDGKTALSLFEKAHASSMPYTLITLDITMPEMSGHDVLLKMREWEKANQVRRTRIVMVTASTDIASVSASLKEGCDGFLAKPFTQDNIAELMRKTGANLQFKLKRPT